MQGEEHLEALNVIGALREAPRALTQLRVIVQVLCFLASPLQLVQWGHPHIDMPLLKQVACIAEQERQQQRADVRPIHISIRQQDDLRTRVSCSTQGLADLSVKAVQHLPSKLLCAPAGCTLGALQDSIAPI